ncbi:MAG: pyrroloquinoline quinone-dependent dehydrogenase [Gemmatimonadales bacterium]
MLRTFLLRLLALLLAAGVAALFLWPVKHHRAVHPVTDAMLLQADSGGEWLTYGRDYSNQRFVPYTEINRGSIKHLQLIWQQGPRRLIKTYQRNESTPLVADGMLIYTDPGMRLASPGNHVFAVDIVTGRQIWSWYRKPGTTALCCSLVNRGAALYGDKVYVATLDAHLIAIDRGTGKTVWDAPVASPADGYSFTMAPLAASGKILIGSSGGEFRIRGFLDAYDAETGKRDWRFWTVPSPADGGWWGNFVSKTPDGDPLHRDTAQEHRDSAAYAGSWKLGGGPVWTTPSYDPTLGLVIFGIGNPSPFEGGVPPGDNLYTGSLAAVDLATGKLRWYYQMIPHDEWDYDPASPTVLVDVVQRGDTIPAVAQAGKTGWVYVVDRRTGARLLRSEPFVPLKNIFPRPTSEGAVTSPGNHGGSGWPAAAYSPATGALYVLGTYDPMSYRVDTTAIRAADARTPHTREHPGKHLFGKWEHGKGTEKFGTVTAVDVSTGKIRWQYKTPVKLMDGGALATGSGLVFFTQPHSIVALDAQTGALVWRHDLGERFVLGPPISFLDHGRQRIAITSDLGITALGLKP